jgi:hypothetical protein
MKEDNVYNKESIVLSITLLIVSIIGLTIVAIVSNKEDKRNDKSIPYRVDPHLLVHPGGVSDIT